MHKKQIVFSSDTSHESDLKLKKKTLKIQHFNGDRKINVEPLNISTNC